MQKGGNAAPNFSRFSRLSRNLSHACCLPRTHEPGFDGLVRCFCEFSCSVQSFPPKNTAASCFSPLFPVFVTYPLLSCGLPGVFFAGAVATTWPSFRIFACT